MTSEGESEASRARAYVLARVRQWVGDECDPELHDALRVLVGLPPLERNEDGSVVMPPRQTWLEEGWRNR